MEFLKDEFIYENDDSGRRCYRFMSAYRLGLSGRAAIFAAKKYKSHRKVPESVLMDVDILSLDD